MFLGWPTWACPYGKFSSHISGISAKSSEISPRRASPQPYEQPLRRKIYVNWTSVDLLNEHFYLKGHWINKRFYPYLISELLGNFTTIKCMQNCFTKRDSATTMNYIAKSGKTFYFLQMKELQSSGIHRTE